MDFRLKPAATNKASREALIAKAAAERDARTTARLRAEAAVRAQAAWRGIRARRAFRAQHMKVFDARLQAIAKLKQALPPTARLPLPPVLLLAAPLLLALGPRGLQKPFCARAPAAAASSFAVKLRAVLSLLRPALEASPAGCLAADAPPLPQQPPQRRTVLRLACCAVELLAAASGAHDDAVLAAAYGLGDGEDEDGSDGEAEEVDGAASGTAPAAPAAWAIAAASAKWDGDLPLGFVLAALNACLPFGAAAGSLVAGAGAAGCGAVATRRAALHGTHDVLEAGLLRASVAALAACRQALGNVRVSSAASRASGSGGGGGPLAAQVEQRCVDLFVLSCAAVALPGASAGGSAAGGAAASAAVSAWADAALCLAPGLVEGLGFGPLAAAAAAAHGWLWPRCLGAVDWAAVAESSTPPRPPWVLAPSSLPAPPARVDRAAAAAAPPSPPPGATATASRTAALVLRPGLLRGRRRANARELAVVAATRALVSGGAADGEGSGEAGSAGGGSDGARGARVEALGWALLARARLRSATRRAGEAFGDCGRAIDLAAVVDGAGDQAANEDDGDVDTAAAAAAAGKLRRRLLPLAFAARLQRAAILEHALDAAPPPHSAAGQASRIAATGPCRGRAAPYGRPRRGRGGPVQGGGLRGLAGGQGPAPRRRGPPQRAPKAGGEGPRQGPHPGHSGSGGGRWR